MTSLKTLAVANYRSIRALVAPLGTLTLVTGANGSGKSNLYRALRLLSDAPRLNVILRRRRRPPAHPQDDMLAEGSPASVHELSCLRAGSVAARAHWA